MSEAGRGREVAFVEGLLYRNLTHAWDEHLLF